MTSQTGLRHITPKRNERSIFVGKTGTGKTTLWLELIPVYKSIIIIDPIHVLLDKLDPREFKLCNSPAELANAGKRHKKLLYQPGPEYLHWEAYNDVYEFIFTRGDTMTVTDEGLRVMRPNGQAPPYMEACYTAGRQRGVGMITCTQRPTKVDLRVMSEAEHYFCFRLRLEMDRERMASLMAEEVMTKPARGHSFYYYRDDDELLKYYTLQLEEDKSA